MGLVFSASATAYAICEVPSGYLGDRFGPRQVLLRIAVWWTAFMAATAAAFSFVSMYLTQLLFGAGQSGCFPNIARLFAQSMKSTRIVRAQGLIWLSARWAGAFTPLLVAVLFRYLTWRQTFLAIGILGIAWAIPFFRSSRGVPSLAAQPSARPWGMLGIGALISGSISGPLSDRLGLVTARRTICCVGFAGASAGLVVAAALHNPVVAVLAVAASSFCNDLVMPVTWAAAADVGGNWSALSRP